jgi:hypothetical protein
MLLAASHMEPRTLQKSAASPPARRHAAHAPPPAPRGLHSFRFQLNLSPSVNLDP